VLASLICPTISARCSRSSCIFEFVASTIARVDAARRRASSMLELMDAYLSSKDIAPEGLVLLDMLANCGCWCCVDQRGIAGGRR